jgi:hypothetical protein
MTRSGLVFILQGSNTRYEVARQSSMDRCCLLSVANTAPFIQPQNLPLNMDTEESPPLSTFELDVFGQNPRLSRLYTQLCFAFPLKDDGQQSQQDAVKYLQKGLQNLSTDVPWLAGNVVQDDSGVYRIDYTRGEAPQLKVRDARHELPTFEQHRRAEFPFHMLNETVIAPCNTIPTDEDHTAWVACLQLTFVKGGMLLVFNGQHNCMDFRGQSVLVYLLSKACRGEFLSEDECKVVKLPRAGIPAISDLEDVTALPINTGDSSGQHTSPVVEESTWAYFKFSSEALSALKATAVSSMDTAFVSTDDVLSAFIWQSVTRARLYRLEADDCHTTFERQIDIRKHLGLPSDYTGIAVYKTSDRMTVEQILQLPLGMVASRLRRSLSPDEGLGRNARVAAAEQLSSLQRPVQQSCQSRSALPSTDIKMSSWAKESCCSFDFGSPFGVAEAVRRPEFKAWEGLVYMMPKALNGDIIVALCLRDADLDRLRSDEAFVCFGQYVG